MVKSTSFPKFSLTIRQIGAIGVTLVEVTDSGYVITYKSENNDVIELSPEDKYTIDFPENIYFYLQTLYKDGSTKEFKQIESTPGVIEQSFSIEDPRKMELIHIYIIIDYDNLELSNVFQLMQDNTIANEIYKALAAYSPDSIFILKSNAESKNTTCRKIIKEWCLSPNNDKTDIFDRINIVVHEETHEFCSDDSTLFLVNNEIINLSIHNSSQWPKTEIVIGELPETMRSYRWKSYVSQDAKAANGIPMDANQNGIFGLLDEFQAYYYGIKAVYDCFPYLRKINGYENDYIARNYIESVYGSLAQSYYEFKYWILLYIDYLKQNMHDLYKIFINNRELLKVLLFFNDSFELLVEKLIPENISAFIDELNSCGVIRFSIQEDEEGVLYLHSKNINDINLSNNGFSIIRKELNQEKYKIMISELKSAII